jgi:hypothetical protein
MKHMILITVAFAVIGTTGSTPVNALSYSYKNLSGNLIEVDAAGHFTDYEERTFVEWLTNYVPRDKVVSVISFNSPGGSIRGAEEVAAIIHRAGWETTTMQGGTCASACVMAWSSGSSKTVATNSWVGVHEAADGVTDKPAPAATQEMADVLKTYGAPTSVVGEEMKTDHTNVYWLSDDELKAWNAARLGEK